MSLLKKKTGQIIGGFNFEVLKNYTAKTIIKFKCEVCNEYEGFVQFCAKLTGAGSIFSLSAVIVNTAAL
jgi:hypothetical protein